MRETKQLHAASKKSPPPIAQLFLLRRLAMPRFPRLCSRANTPSEMASRMQESNPFHQIFGGNRSRMGVTYPPVSARNLAPPACAAQSGLQFYSRISLTHSAYRSSWQRFCLREQLNFKIDGGSSAYD